jgi:hypothetical protein
LARFCPEDGRKSLFFTLRSIDPSGNSFLIHPRSVSLDYRFHAFIDDAVHRNIRKVVALSADKPPIRSICTERRSSAPTSSSLRHADDVIEALSQVLSAYALKIIGVFSEPASRSFEEKSITGRAYFIFRRCCR